MFNIPNLDRVRLLTKIEVFTEIPLMLLSIVMIPLLVGPFLWEMSDSEKFLFFILDILIWIVFLIDMLIKVTISVDRLDYIKSNWIEVIVVLVPWFRPFRIFRLVVFALKTYKGFSRACKPDFLLIYAFGFVIVASTLLTTFEQNNMSALDSFVDSVWWSVVTITTVGYGDMVPESSVGRIVAVFLMLGGISIFGAITANIASLVSAAEDPNTKLIEDLTREIEQLKLAIENK